MARRDDAHRDLLFGLLALHNGMVSRDQLVAAFGAWTAATGKTLAGLLVDQGAITPAHRSVLDALAEAHLNRHGGDAERTLASLELGSSARERLAWILDPDVQASLACVGTGSGPTERTGEPDPDATASYAVGSATSEGQRFRVLRPHAQGGLGTVFVALDSELHREVALKQILEEHADNLAMRQRFLLEAEVTGGLEHPGIVPVYGLGTYGDGRPYYAMRFVRGDSLKEAIEAFHRRANINSPSPLVGDGGDLLPPRGGGLRWGAPPQGGGAADAPAGSRDLALRKLLRRFTDVCNAIDYAHSRGVLHRDINPGNIIVGRYGETLVVDWGLAKATGRADPDSGERTLRPSSPSGSAETLPGWLLGTPAYMSPEQAEGNLEQLGPRSDVYSLGATLYCLLTGRPPFAGDAADVIRAVQRGEFAAPRQLDPGIDRALEAVCKKAMALKPEDRYGAPRALVDDLERWMADEPVSAWDEPWTRRAGRWGRRNRPLVSAMAVAVLAGLIGLGAVAALQARSNAALWDANHETQLALLETREEQAKAEEALAQSEEVRSFLVDAFRSPDPSLDGKEIKVADVLDRASRRLDQDFHGSQATLGSLLDALGRTYLGLGLPAAAGERLERAAAVREKALGRDHPDTLSTRIYTVALYADPAGRVADAIALGEAMRTLTDAKLGPEHPLALECHHNLAVAYDHAGRSGEAIALHEATLKTREAKLGPDDPDTLASRNDLAVAYQRAGRTKEALVLHEGTLRLRKAQLGPDHPGTLASRNNLAIAYDDAGRTTEAIALHESTFKLAESKLGPDHPDTLICRNALAKAYLSAGRTADAIPLLEQTLEMKESKLRPDHPDTLITRNELAKAYLAAGHTADALALYERTLKLYESKLAPDHPLALVGRTGLAVAYYDAGRMADAIALLEATLKLMEPKLGPDHPHTLTTRGNLAMAYRAAGRLAEAVTIQIEELKRNESKQGPDHPDTIISRNNLAGTYELLARWTDAETLRRDALVRRRKGVKPDSPLLAGDLDGLGRNLLKQGRESEAEPILRECLVIREKVIPNDWRRYHAMSLLGGILLARGRHAEAEPLIVPGYEGMKARQATIRATNKPLLLEAALRVVRLYDSWGKPDQARVWKAKLGLDDLPDDVFGRS